MCGKMPLQISRSGAERAERFDLSAICSRLPSDYRRPLGDHSPRNVVIKTSTKVQSSQPLAAALTPYFQCTGTRQAYLPGGHRTGAPGKHVVNGSAKYRLLDEKVRIFVAPSQADINRSPVRTTHAS